MSDDKVREREATAAEIRAARRNAYEYDTPNASDEAWLLAQILVQLRRIADDMGRRDA